jgi:hypothetical protein
MIDVDELKRRLDASKRRRLLEKCGFDLSGERGDELNGVLGPKSLGAGKMATLKSTSRKAE